MTLHDMRHRAVVCVTVQADLSVRVLPMRASWRAPHAQEERRWTHSSAADRARPSYARFCGDRPHVRSRSGVPEPEFDVEYEVLAAGTAGSPQPLIVGCPGAVARVARWSSTVFWLAPMVLTDRCVASASCHCRIAVASLSRSCCQRRRPSIPRLAAKHAVPDPEDGAAREAGLVPARRRRRRRRRLGRDRRKPGSLRCRGPRRRADGHGRRLGAGDLPSRHRPDLPPRRPLHDPPRYRPARAE